MTRDGSHGDGAASSGRPVAPRLQVHGARKRYGAVQAIQHADLEVLPGEVMALVGENGAGKSTLVKIVCGIVRADGGTIAIDGDPCDLGTTRKAEEAGVAVVQQELSVVDVLTVGENVLLGNRRAGFFTSRARQAQASRRHLDTVGLADLDPLTPIDQLPVASRQLVEIARVVSRDARLILLDEPTAALSDDDILRVKAVVRRLSEEGRSIIYITHRLGEVFDLANRVTVMRDGTSQPPVDTASITPADLIQRMIGRPLANMFPPRSTARGDVVLEVEGLLTGGVNEPVGLTLRRGEILGLAGQLGSGATSVLRALGGGQPIVAGDVRVGGAPLSVTSPYSALAGGLAYCSGDRKVDGFFSGRRVLENLTAPALDEVTPSGMLRRGRERALGHKLAQMVDFDSRRLRDRVSTLSGGNQQKVVLGKWIGARPQVLLIDEPTRGVDVGARAEIYRHLRDLAADGLAIVFASSDPLEVQGLADRVATFFRGRLVRSYDAEHLDQVTLSRDVTHPAAVAV